MAQNDVHVIKLHGSYKGQKTLNVFHYIQNTADVPGVNTCQQLVDGFISTIATSIQAPLVNTATFNLVECFGYRLPAVFNFTRPISWVGQVAQTENTVGLPTSVAITFRSNRNGPGTRYGYKRLAGLPSNAFDVDGNLETSYVNLLSDFAQDMLVGIDNGGIIFQPFVVQGPKQFGVNPAGYRITLWSFLKIGTQNTRKP